MKKLFAMLLALCMMCGPVSVGAESILSMLSLVEPLRAVTGTQTVAGFTFDIPAGWTADLTGTSLTYSLLGLEDDGRMTSQSILLSHEADAAIRISVQLAPVTSENNKTAMDVINGGAGLKMVSPAEIRVHGDRGAAQSGQTWGPQIEFVTIGSLAGEPIRRTYSGYIGEYLDENGNTQKARVSAVVWSSELVGMEIVIKQITPQYAQNYDHVVDEFMKSFCYDGQTGTYDDSAAAAAQKIVSANDFNTSSIEGAKAMWGRGAYLFDLAHENAGVTNPDAYRIVTDDTDLSDFDLGMDFGDYGAWGEAMENINPDDYDFGDFGGYDWTGSFGW